MVTDRTRKDSDMLFLLMINLLYWTQTEGGCSGAMVSIFGGSRVLAVGQGFSLSCEFSCLGPQHVAQLWRDNGNKERVSLINITSIVPDVTVLLNVSSATKADSGYYSCMTLPPDTISPEVLIEISDNLTTPPPTTPGTQQSCSTQQHNRAAGLLGQIWYWILLGKTTVLLLSLATLAVKYKRRMRGE